MIYHAHLIIEINKNPKKCSKILENPPLLRYNSICVRCSIKGCEPVDISWYGHSCFRISERGKVTVVTDPFSESLGLEVPKLKGDVVTVSHDVPGHNFVEAVKGQRYVLSRPGEYEIGGVFITGIPLHMTQEDEPRTNIGYLLQYDSLSVLHLGDLAHVPDQSAIEKIGEVNVLLIPVGGGNGLKANQAADVVSLIEPHYVVPMHYAMPGLNIELDDIDKFLKTMGITHPVQTDVLRVTTSDLPEQPQVVLLSPQV